MSGPAEDLATEPPVEAALRMPKIRGAALERLPEDLYIPPDALEVILEAFEGPLDLLLYLIRRQNLDILDIPVARITEQYMQYISLMRQLKLELAAEYLLMAALLAEIKSRMLLPRPAAEEQDAGDPRVELVRRLQEYERFKTAADQLDALPRVGRDIPLACARPELALAVEPMPAPPLRDLLLALREVLQRADLYTQHRVSREPLSVRERMTRILSRLQRDGATTLTQLLDPREGRAGVVVCMLALLELVKLAVIELVQDAPFAEIMLDAAGPRAAQEANHG
jgi:segregation and condensation protein A